MENSNIAKEMDAVKVSEETKLMLDERLEYHRLNPTEGATWQEVREKDFKTKAVKHSHYHL